MGCCSGRDKNESHTDKIYNIEDYDESNSEQKEDYFDQEYFKNNFNNPTNKNLNDFTMTDDDNESNILNISGIPAITNTTIANDDGESKVDSCFAYSVKNQNKIPENSSSEKYLNAKDFHIITKEDNDNQDEIELKQIDPLNCSFGDVNNNFIGVEKKELDLNQNKSDNLLDSVLNTKVIENMLSKNKKNSNNSNSIQEDDEEDIENNYLNNNSNNTNSRINEDKKDYKNHQDIKYSLNLSIQPVQFNFNYELHKNSGYYFYKNFNHSLYKPLIRISAGSNCGTNIKSQCFTIKGVKKEKKENENFNSNNFDLVSKNSAISFNNTNTNTISNLSPNNTKLLPSNKISAYELSINNLNLNTNDNLQSNDINSNNLLTNTNNYSYINTESSEIHNNNNNNNNNNNLINNNVVLTKEKRKPDHISFIFSNTHNFNITINNSKKNNNNDYLIIELLINTHNNSYMPIANSILYYSYFLTQTNIMPNNTITLKLLNNYDFNKLKIVGDIVLEVGIEDKEILNNVPALKFDFNRYIEKQKLNWNTPEIDSVNKSLLYEYFTKPMFIEEEIQNLKEKFVSILKAYSNISKEDSLISFFNEITDESGLISNLMLLDNSNKTKSKYKLTLTNCNQFKYYIKFLVLAEIFNKDNHSENLDYEIIAKLLIKERYFSDKFTFSFIDSFNEAEMKYQIFKATKLKENNLFDNINTSNSNVSYSKPKRNLILFNSILKFLTNYYSFNLNPIEQEVILQQFIGKFKFFLHSSIKGLKGSFSSSIGNSNNSGNSIFSYKFNYSKSNLILFLNLFSEVFEFRTKHLVNLKIDKESKFNNIFINICHSDCEVSKNVIYSIGLEILELNLEMSSKKQSNTKTIIDFDVKENSLLDINYAFIVFCLNWIKYCKAVSSFSKISKNEFYLDYLLVFNLFNMDKIENNDNAERVVLSKNSNSSLRKVQSSIGKKSSKSIRKDNGNLIPSYNKFRSTNIFKQNYYNKSSNDIVIGAYEDDNNQNDSSTDNIKQITHPLIKLLLHVLNKDSETNLNQTCLNAKLNSVIIEMLFEITTEISHSNIYFFFKIFSIYTISQLFNKELSINIKLKNKNNTKAFSNMFNILTIISKYIKYITSHKDNYSNFLCTLNNNKISIKIMLITLNNIIMYFENYIQTEINNNLVKIKDKSRLVKYKARFLIDIVSNILEDKTLVKTFTRLCEVIYNLIKYINLNKDEWKAFSEEGNNSCLVDCIIIFTCKIAIIFAFNKKYFVSFKQSTLFTNLLSNINNSVNKVTYYYSKTDRVNEIMRNICEKDEYLLYTKKKEEEASNENNNKEKSSLLQDVLLSLNNYFN